MLPGADHLAELQLHHQGQGPLGMRLAPDDPCATQGPVSVSSTWWLRWRSWSTYLPTPDIRCGTRDEVLTAQTEQVLVGTAMVADTAELRRGRPAPWHRADFQSWQHSATFCT